MEFVFNGSDFDIPINAGNFYAAANIRILVNDRIVATSALPVFNNGSWYQLRVTFPSAATRRIRIEGAGGGRWLGVNCANPGDVTPSQRNYPLVSVMGDSFVEGTGTTGFDGEAVVIARALGLDIAPGGVGGTGLIAPGTGGRVNWVNPTRITDLTLKGASGNYGVGNSVPALGVMMMSINDNAQAPGIYGATLQEAITNCLTLIEAWVATNPGKPLVFIGPTWPCGSPTLEIHRTRDGGPQGFWQAQTSSNMFIDRMGQLAQQRVLHRDGRGLAFYGDGRHPSDLSWPHFRRSVTGGAAALDAVT